MPEALLARLLGVLEPGQAQWILAYLDEARAAHEKEPLIDEAAPAFSRRLWTIVLRDALHRAGLHANRRAFLQNLILRMSESAGENYSDLLLELRRILEAVPQAGRQPGSLLRTLDELAQCEEGVETSAQAAFSTLASILEGRATTAGWLASDGVLRPLDEARQLAAEGFITYGAEAHWLLSRLTGSQGSMPEERLRPLLRGLPPPATGPGRDAQPWPVRGDCRTRLRPDGAAGAVDDRDSEVRSGDPSALVRLDRLLSSAEAEPAQVSEAVAGAAQEDPVGTRRLLRRMARADPAAFARRIEADAATAAGLLIGAETGGTVRRLLDMLRPSPDETASLLRLFCDLPSTATVERAFSDTLQSIAAARGADAGDLAKLLLAGVPSRPGGIDERRLSTQLAAFAAPESPSRAGEEPEHWRILALLRAALLTGSALPVELGPTITRLAPIPAVLLRRSLRGTSRSEQVASALRDLGEESLLRLALLLMRDAPAGRERLRQQLRSAEGRRSELLRIATGLLEKGDPPGRDPESGGGRRKPSAELPKDEWHDLWALVRTDGATVSSALLPDAGAFHRLFGSLPASERKLVLDLARLLLQGPARDRLPGDALRRSLASAAARRLRLGSAASLTAIWREELESILPQRARPALQRAIDERWPAQKNNGEARAAFGLRDGPTPGAESAPGTATLAPPERGSLAWVLALLDDDSARARRLLRSVLRSERMRAWLCRSLPERMLLRLVQVQAPREARPLLRTAEALATAISRCGGQITGEGMWAALLEAVVAPDAVRALVDRLVADPTRRERGRRGKHSRELVERIETEAAAIASSRGLGSLKSAIQERDYDRRLATAARREESPAPARKLWDPLPVAEGRRVALANAGLVLVGPFLPQFFERLGLLAKNGTFRRGEAPSRGVHLLQYLVDGRCDAAEPGLALNKLLCGLDPSQPLLASIEPDEKELETCDSLLEAMISTWPLMRGSSPAALRETFLQRDGVLIRGPEGWRVEVDRRTLDVLMEDLPWSFSMILHPWMDGLISVTW
jgi:hypothetical protein